MNHGFLEVEVEIVIPDKVVVEIVSKVKYISKREHRRSSIRRLTYLPVRYLNFASQFFQGCL